MVSKNNKGFSLVEMIIIIAIMVIVTVGASVAALNWRGSYLSDCVKKIDSGLAAAKVDCMSKETGSLVIRYDSSEELYYMQVSEEEEEQLGDDKIKIYYKTSASSNYVEITESNEITLSFYRATGGFKEKEINGAGTKIYFDNLKVVRAGKEVKIKLEKDTGNYYIED